MRFIAFDLETTGTVPGVDQIVEIGAVRFNNGLVEAVFSTLVDPQKPIPPGASAVNGITDDMVHGKPTIDTLLTSFAEFCEDSVMVAHNAPFDSAFLTLDIRKYESPAPRGIIIDTLTISRKVFPGLPNYKLGTLVQHLKIPSTGFHRAEEDATYCGQVFVEMIKRISVAGKTPQIENLIALTGKTELRFPQIERQPKQMGFLF
ncbi:MAG: DNA polymerase III subunit epsilon [Bdellovibrionales bacterium RIFCSPHIGHO2_01_FULL_40_29]|nr:MAG: DNA polymerase III subunit epsilon [Bdellovibrionales bacterium RIFCSPHIGHO2_01_FULL_40_29]OFZ34739.1 MAG: DNA polymerase III subunit epsilon [Bdellovibrionales bacterium RIFCSPHIGHO2_02_FULL_40_15]